MSEPQEKWQLAKVSDIAEVVSGIGFPNSFQGRIDKEIPFYKVGDISKTVKKGETRLTSANNYVDFEDLKKLKGKLFPEGTIVFAKIGEALKLNRRAVLSVPALVDNNVMGIIPRETVSSKFLYYYFLTQDLAQFSAGNTVPSIRKSSVEGISVPLPPLAEQKRIVAKLDQAFKHLETLKAKLERIPELLKKFRQTVLTNAVTGKLTEEWRKGKELEVWREVTLQEVADMRLGKMLDKNKNHGPLIPYLGNINVRWFEFELSNLQHIRATEEDLLKYELKEGDVLVCEGGEPGRSAVWKGHKEQVIYQKALHRVRLERGVLPEFLVYNLSVDATSGKLSSLFTGTTIKHLTVVRFASYSFLLPERREQIEIVKKVIELSHALDQIESRYLSAKAKIEDLRKQILAKSFRGELV